MGLPFAPAIAPFPAASPFAAPAVAPGISTTVPFVRPGLPVVPAPALPIVPPPPVLPALTVAPALRTSSGLLRFGAVGAAVLGAGTSGLAIGNAIYEDVLRRPFGPSVGDMLFPLAQPFPVPVRDPQPYVDPRGQCFTNYIVNSTVTTTYRGVTNGYPQSLTDVRGPITKILFRQSANGQKWELVMNSRDLIEKSLGGDFFDPGTTPTAVWEIVRQDGQPDDCGPVVLPVVEPKALKRRPTLPRPTEIPLYPPVRAIPEPLRLPQPGPGFTPTVEPVAVPEPTLQPSGLPLLLPFPNPVLRPFDVPDPLPGPLPGPNPPARPPFIPTPGLECCPSLEQKLDKLADRDEPEECDLSEIEDLLEQILDKLDGDGNGNFDLTPCVSEEPVLLNYQGAGLSGVYSAIAGIMAALNLIHADTKCPPEGAILAVPDWWSMRRGADRPQLSVVLRKGNTRNYHTLNIPHPIIDPPPSESPISPYVAGNWQATIYLIDNSKFIVNAENATVANRVALEAAAAINPRFLDSPLKISITERRGFPVNVDIMVPRYLQYFPEGQKSRRPLWRVPLD